MAAFTVSPSTGTAPLTVQFTDTSTNTPTQWIWSFGDGTGTSTVQNPSYTYTAAGTYTATLTAINAAGGNVCTKTITVNSVATAVPVPLFSGTPVSGASPLTVQFTDASTGSPTTWNWTFGDGNTSTAESPSYTYVTDGTYDVTLTETNAMGSNSTTQTGYIVVGAATVPEAGFSADTTSGTAPLIVQFTDTSTGTPTSWTWDFGDGTSTSVENPSHTYTSAGTYSISLVASNAAGSNTSVESGYITVSGDTSVTTADTPVVTLAADTPVSTPVPGYTYVIPSPTDQASVSDSSSGSKAAAGGDAWVEEENKKMEALDAGTPAAPQQTDIVSSVISFVESLFSWI